MPKHDCASWAAGLDRRGVLRDPRDQSVRLDAVRAAGRDVDRVVGVLPLKVRKHAPVTLRPKVQGAPTLLHVVDVRLHAELERVAVKMATAHRGGRGVPRLGQRCVNPTSLHLRTAHRQEGRIEQSRGTHWIRGREQGRTRVPTTNI